MKPWPLVLGMIVLLAVVCSPGLAIPKSEIFPQYQRGFPLSPIPIPPTLIPWGHMPTPPAPTPTQTPREDPTWNPDSLYHDISFILPTPTLTPSSGGPGSISVTSTPTRAEVYLDGTYKGTTPITLSGIPFGIHFLKFCKKYGYQDYSKTGCIFLEEENRKIHVNLFRSSYHDEWDLCEDGRYSVDAKPNIYLYSDHDLTAQVRLMPEGAIIVSDPVYQPGMGWQAAIWNGSLNGKGDFLFYEGLVPNSKWQKREGYVIRATYRGQDMAFMLGQYGFNEKETAEFIDYWVSHLPRDVDYVFYPQETEAVEQVMPLIISPEPDHVMRIHFYAEPLVSTPEPVTSPEKIVREGFYVVEWGVMVKDK